jgi:hypothetical protein
MFRYQRSLTGLFVLFIILLPSNGFLLASESSYKFLQDTVANQNKSPKQPVYTTSRLITTKPVIDGKLDDECWKKGTWAGNFTQFVPNEGAKPTYPTELNIQYDDKNLYVAFRAFDGEPEKIVRMAGVRDEIVGDMIGLAFDSYRDYRTAFEFSMSAWGQKVDLVLFNPMQVDLNWNAVWKAKTGLEDSAWVAEYEIPLSQLRYSNKDDQVWGLSTWRLISRISEESNWEKQSKIGPGMLYNFGELKGITGLKKSRRLELMPFILGDLKTMEEESGNPFTKNGRALGGNAGLDAKIGVSSNFTIDLTVNPDFGQVESDPSVMNLSAFETFYEEKRPFFLEGLTIFDYKFDEQSLFYSRRIGHSPSLTIEPNDSLFVKSPDKTTIMSAIKFSGTTSKGLSVGLIQSLTANMMAKVSDTDGNKSTRPVEPMTNYVVARVQQGYNAGNTVFGGIFTSTNRFIEDPSLEFLTKNAYSGGLDLLTHWKDKEFYLDTRMTGSYVEGTTGAITALQESSAHYYQRPGADYLGYDTSLTNLSGYGGKFKIGKGSKGFWRYSTGATWLSPGVELNDLGYMPTADVINQENNISYLINQTVSVFHSYNIGLEQFNSWNFNGTYLGSGGHLSFASEFTNNWNFETNLIFHSQQVDTRILRGGPDMIMPNNIMTFGLVKTDQSRKLIFDFAYEYEKSGNGSATNYTFGPGISLRPVQYLKIGVSANYAGNYDNLQYVTEKDYLAEKRYILGTIDQKTLGLTLRLDLNITPEFSVQYYGSPFVSLGQYSTFKKITNPDAETYDERFEVLSTTLLPSGGYGVDDNNDMTIDYTIENPDFNFHEFRSNLVAKWEYRLGSFIYFVWSMGRTGTTGSSDISLGESYKELRSVYPENIFLIKLNYWFSL